MRRKILITGGTGTVGESFIKEYYNDYYFVVLSRNEAKIAQLLKTFPLVTSYITDVTNYEQLDVIIAKERPDIIIHSAAIKHIDIAEKNPTSAILSNVVGSYNIIKTAIKNNISLTVGISTDKACNPKSVYGYTKKLMEEMFMDNHTTQNRFVCTRFANVAGSNGSVIPFWKKLINDGSPIKLTDPNMNRLMFTKRDAARLIHAAIDISDADYSKSFILSKKMKSVNLYDLAKLMSNGKEIQIVGLRPGEKLNESLISSDEMKFVKYKNDYIIIPKDKSTINDSIIDEYSSLTASRASIDEINEFIYQD
jgi:UDP-N-acetylglucosamine 4,6-dehydratase